MVQVQRSGVSGGGGGGGGGGRCIRSKTKMQDVWTMWDMNAQENQDD